MIFEDFNAYHPDWVSNKTSRNGEHLLQRSPTRTCVVIPIQVLKVILKNYTALLKRHTKNRGNN